MGVFNNPKLQFYLRITQLAVAIAFLVSISYAGVHRGWWKNINAALAVGVIATVITFAVTIHGILVHLRKNPFAGAGKALYFAQLGVEIITVLLWIATAALMLQKKGGCKRRGIQNGLDLCVDKSTDTPIRHSDRPKISWALGIAFAFVEIAGFILTFITVLLGNRATESSSRV